MNTKIIAVANQKGGVGKTTTAVNLSTALAACGMKVLLVDFDPQGNASTGLGIEPDSREHNSYQLIISELDIGLAIQPTLVPQLDIIPAIMDLSAAEIELSDQPAWEYRLKEALAPVSGNYDYIFIDCPPSLGVLTVNAMVASDTVLVPLQCEFYALEGLSQLIGTVDLVQKGLNTGLSMQGIVLTMYDTRNKLSESVEADVREYFGQLVYKTIIPRNVRVSEAPSFGQPVLMYDIKSSGSQAYAALAAELLQQEGLA